MKTFSLFFTLLFAFVADGQVNDTAFALVKTYRGDIAGAAMDNFDNLYLISSTGQVKKFGPKGDSIAVFNGVRAYGKLAAADVSNPLKPLLFYKDFSTVVILDRFLAPRTTLDFRRFNVLQPTAVALSYDNNIWVYDAFDHKLRKMDEAGVIQLETPDFRQLFGKGIAPQRIINDNGFVYLADSAAGVYVFDNYGTFKRKIELKGWTNIDVRNGAIICMNTTGLVVYNPTTLLEQQRSFPKGFTPYAQSFLNGNRLVTFGGDALSIYSFR